MASNPVATTVLMVATVLLLGPGGCDNAGSAVETRDRTGEVGVRGDDAGAGAPEPSTRAGRVKPPVTANRRETVDAKVERLFQRNGTAFGARSPDDYLAKMKGFIDSPPRGVETVSRPNGDVLYYEATTNTFAVAARDGTPRTMFKPDDGAAYWAEQKARAPTFGRNRIDTGSGTTAP